MTKLRTLANAPIGQGTRVIVRADFDVPLKGEKITDPFRIVESVPTLKFILKKGGYLRLIAKIGRPEGKFVRSLSVKPVARYLEKLLGRRVLVVADPFDARVFKKYNFSQGPIIFENIRFWPEEEKGDPSFAKKLARWGDVYVNEAFAMSHRNDASVAALARLLPSFAGLHLAKEIRNLDAVLGKPKRPFIVILGGIKLETKLPLVRRFLKEADRVLVGGALANTFLRAKGFETGKSFVEDLRDLSILRSKKLCLPVDVVAARALSRRSSYRVASADAAQKSEYIVDIGPKSVRLFSSLVQGAKTIVWNGPLGLTPDFAEGSVHFAKALGKVGAFKVTGGGDTAEMLRRYNLLKKFNHVSTGGGAMLEFLAGKKLPGIEVLRNSKFKNQNAKLQPKIQK